MLGNLFGQRNPNQPNQSVGKPANLQNQTGSVFNPATENQDQSQMIGSSMQPKTRQDLSVLTHLDTRTVSVLQQAEQETKTIQQQTIEPEQLLVGLLFDSDIFQLFQESTSDSAKVLEELKKREKHGTFTGQPTLGDATRQIFEKAYAAAKRRDVEFITPEDVLVTLVATNASLAQFLESHGFTKDVLEKKLSKNAEYVMGKKSVLSQYGVDLTAEAEEGKLDPITGRDKEIDRLVHILLRRTKNNPIIIGEAGVGKTAIVEGLAERIISHAVPAQLQDRRIIELDLAALVAGASHRGEFEERLRDVIREAQVSNGKIILFIDEIHTLIGAGDTQGAMDASNIIKPYLARGQIQIIGTTTIAEFRKYFEKDKAFERRFQSVLADEPDEETAIKMLEVLKPKYELFHHVTISDEAIKSAVQLSKKYIGERHLPDKAVDLMDEAAAQVKLRMNTSGQATQDKQMESKDGDDKEEKTKQVKGPDGAKLDDKDTIHNTDEKQVSDTMQQKDHEQKDAEPVNTEASKKDDDGVSKDDAKTQDAQNKEAMKEAATDGIVRKSDIELVVSEWTGVPITKLTEDEGNKLLKLEETIHKRLIDQDEAVKAVSEAVRRGRIGLAASGRPIASFIFLGPTGVGKTELAKTLAEIMFGRDDAFVRLDMSEYMEKHEVAKLIGAPPGYVGYEEGGQLTEAVRKKPYSIVLLDEVEKAHPDVFNILLQLLEDGRLTDNKGNTVSFKNTILIATSNIGSSAIQQELNKQAEAPIESGQAPQNENEVFAKLKEMLVGELTKFFRPELLNRFDEVVVFRPLRRQDMSAIAKLGIDKTAKLLSDQDFKLQITQKALDELALEGYDPVYGARPLRRLIQTAIENPIALEIIKQKFMPGDTITIDYKTQNNEFVFLKADEYKGQQEQAQGQPNQQTADATQNPQDQVMGVDQSQTPQVPGQNLGQPQQPIPVTPTESLQQGPVMQQPTSPSGAPSQRPSSQSSDGSQMSASSPNQNWQPQPPAPVTA